MGQGWEVSEDLKSLDPIKHKVSVMSGFRVHLDGRAIKSCSMLAVQAAGRSLTTIEGVAATDGTLHPMQAAFNECHGLQCGFCTPGMVMSAIDLVQHHKCSSDAEIREGLEGNICRCTGYQNIVKAVQMAAPQMSATA